MKAPITLKRLAPAAANGFHRGLGGKEDTIRYFEFSLIPKPWPGAQPSQAGSGPHPRVERP